MQYNRIQPITVVMSTAFSGPDDNNNQCWVKAKNRTSGQPNQGSQDVYNKLN